MNCISWEQDNGGIRGRVSFWFRTSNSHKLVYLFIFLVCKLTHERRTPYLWWNKYLIDVSPRFSFFSVFFRSFCVFFSEIVFRALVELFLSKPICFSRASQIFCLPFFGRTRFHRYLSDSPNAPIPMGVGDPRGALLQWPFGIHAPPHLQFHIASSSLLVVSVFLYPLHFAWHNWYSNILQIVDRIIFGFFFLKMCASANTFSISFRLFLICCRLQSTIIARNIQIFVVLFNCARQIPYLCVWNKLHSCIDVFRTSYFFTFRFQATAGKTKVFPNRRRSNKSLFLFLGEVKTCMECFVNNLDYFRIQYFPRISLACPIFFSLTFTWYQRHTVLKFVEHLLPYRQLTLKTTKQTTQKKQFSNVLRTDYIIICPTLHSNDFSHPLHKHLLCASGKGALRVVKCNILTVFHSFVVGPRFCGVDVLLFGWSRFAREVRASTPPAKRREPHAIPHRPCPTLNLHKPATSYVLFFQAENFFFVWQTRSWSQIQNQE